MKRPLIVALLCLSTSMISHAQDRLVISPTDEAPKMDGVLNDRMWNEIPALKMVSLNPVAGQAPFQPTEVRITYTSKDLYVAAWMFDSNPEEIRATSKIRDDLDLTNDWFGICLDSYLDRENALMFGTNPHGLRTDTQIYNDGEGEFPMKEDWNTVWEVQTSQDEKGWYVEMRIPLSSLRYQKTGEMVLMGLGLFRYIPRSQEWDTYPAMSNEWDFWSWAKPSQYQTIEFHGIESVNPLYFSPYVLGGVEQKTSLNEAEDAYGTNTKWARNAGLDVKYGITKNLTLDLTLNTDFAQVEADDQKINLTRFSLFFPEKRQFFLERSSIFDVIYGNTGQLFYSRRIGLDNGRQVPVWGGGRLTGRMGNWDIGAMVLQTGSLFDDQTDEELVPTRNNSVLRFRRKLGINSNSYVGGMSTLILDPSGKYNWNYALDGILNVYKNDYLNFIWSQTLDSEDQGSIASLEPAKFYVDYQRRTYDGLSYDVNFTRAGSRYNPELGFEYRQDYSRLGTQVGYGWNLADRSKWIQKQSLNFMAYSYRLNETGEIETLEVEPEYDLSLQSLHSFYLQTPYQLELVKDTFYLSKEVFVPEGDYRFLQAELNYNTPTWELITGEAEISSGQFYDGWINSIKLAPSLRFAGSWILNFNYQINQISFPVRDQSLISHLAGFKLIYMYNTHLTGTSYMQYNSLIDQFIWNIRLRYNPKEGVDLYIVYNDYINSKRNDFMPPLPFSLQRTLLVKYTHTIRMR